MSSVMEIGAFEAKTRFSELIEMVSEGREILVTKRGEPMARIVPVADRTDSIARLLREFEAVRAGARPGPSLRELKEEGRR
ncbi:MAG TPA: type II toxin-antitoxin system prevent-host-death family antitoxin [Rectinemataceae bacterium]|nr:type II toxin-antitoxin system prevent-host-death family antitoxin [Rectinemataceae bacterium]